MTDLAVLLGSSELNRGDLGSFAPSLIFPTDRGKSGDVSQLGMLETLLCLRSTASCVGQRNGSQLPLQNTAQRGAEQHLAAPNARVKSNSRTSPESEPFNFQPSELCWQKAFNSFAELQMFSCLFHCQIGSVRTHRIRHNCAHFGALISRFVTALKNNPALLSPPPPKPRATAAANWRLQRNSFLFLSLSPWMVTV